MRTKTCVWLALCATTALSVGLMVLAIFFYELDPEDSKSTEETDDSLKTIKTHKTSFVLFYSLEHEDHQFQSNWARLRDEFQRANSTQDIYIGKIECSVFRASCYRFGVEVYPTIAWIRNGILIEKYIGDDRLGSLRKFFNKYAMPEKRNVTVNIKTNTSTIENITQVSIIEQKINKTVVKDTNEKFIDREKANPVENKSSEIKKINESTVETRTVAENNSTAKSVLFQPNLNLEKTDEISSFVLSTTQSNFSTEVTNIDKKANETFVQKSQKTSIKEVKVKDEIERKIFTKFSKEVIVNESKEQKDLKTPKKEVDKNGVNETGLEKAVESIKHKVSNNYTQAFNSTSPLPKTFEPIGSSEIISIIKLEEINTQKSEEVSSTDKFMKESDSFEGLLMTRPVHNESSDESEQSHGKSEQTQDESSEQQSEEEEGEEEEENANGDDVLNIGELFKDMSAEDEKQDEESEETDESAYQGQGIEEDETYDATEIDSKTEKNERKDENSAEKIQKTTKTSFLSKSKEPHRKHN